MNERLNISTGAVWEDIVGYSRAVRIGNQVEISGTVAVRDGLLIGKDDPYQQTKCILEIIKESLKKTGAELDDVIRTRIFVTDIGQWQEIAKAHSEVFDDIKPATSMVEVNRLISPEYLLEIEATAILQYSR